MQLGMPMSGMPSLGSVMTPLPHSIDVGQDVVTARVLMEEHGIHHLAVTSNGKIAGVVTDRDIQVAGSLAPEREGELLVREVCHMPAYVAEAAEPLDVVLDERLRVLTLDRALHRVQLHLERLDVAVEVDGRKARRELLE